MSGTGWVDVDPAVLALVGGGGMGDGGGEPKKPKGVTERRKLAKARAKAKARERVMLDLPDGITERLKAEAERLGVTASQVAACLLACALNDGTDLAQFRRLNPGSRRYEFRLIAPDVAQRDTAKKTKGHP